MVVVQKGSFDYVSSSFCRFIYTTALDVLGKANRPVEALNVFHSMQVLYIYIFLHIACFLLVQYTLLRGKRKL